MGQIRPGQTPGVLFMDKFAIVLGYRCNFKCEHCIVGDKKGTGLTAAEKDLVALTVRRGGIGNLLFVGGEPTLYIPDMNEIVSKLGNPLPNIRMTTNGHFAKSKAAAVKVLRRISGLSGINLSYDSLHEKFLPEENIENLYLACKEVGLGFAVLLSLRSPMDLALLNKIRKAGKFRVLIQKLLPVGAARSNDLGFKYPSFNEGALSMHCPTRDNLIYMCGQGFTVCCGALAFGPGVSRAVFPTLEGLMSSDFYKLVAKNSFSGMIRKLRLTGLKFKPEHSAPCVLCEYLFKSKYGEQT